jgi:hypothetical protein
MTAQPFLDVIAGPWIVSRDGDDTARSIFNRHYSRRRYADGRAPKIFVGPGEKMVLLTPCARALFVWRKFISDDGQQGVSCAIFRNEGAGLASELIRAAEALAWARWPGERFYTYVNPRRVRSANPGCCFKKAGWRRCGLSRGGLIIFERLPLAGGAA